MSETTHCEMNGCDNDDGRIFWTAHCSCGWDGEARSGSEAAQIARRDFGEHVTAELGEASRYEAPVVCVNCSYRGPASILVGLDVWSAICPMCNCSGRLRPQDLHDQRAERGEVS